MSRSIILAVASSLLAATLAFANPAVTVDYREGVPQVRLAGDWSGTRYTIWRAEAEHGAYARVTSDETLCLGACFVDDYSADPGATYWYRFDLLLADGTLASYGPYPVTISTELAWRVNATVFPNPGRGATSVNLFLAGAPGAAPLAADASIFDVQGRLVRALHRGSLARGLTRIEWDGRDRDGQSLRAGVYYLRFSSPLGATLARVVRVQ